MIERAHSIREQLKKSKFNVDRWAKKLGYVLKREPIEGDNLAMLVKRLTTTEIILKPGMNKPSEIACIAHEDCHNHFHPVCIAFRGPFTDLIESIEEGQAEMFSSLVLIESLDGFDTEDEFLRSGYPASIAEMRLAYFRKYEQNLQLVTI